jgi:hypothetical protein
VSVSPTTLNFGSQKIGTKSNPLPVTVTNHGSAALNISSIKINLNASGNYSQTNDCGSQLAAGASCTINVIFAPVQNGKIQSQLAITDDGGASPQIVSLTGRGLLLLPIFCDPKFSVVGETLTNVPTPVSSITCGFVEALSRMVMVPEKPPLFCGWKVEVILQLAPEATRRTSIRRSRTKKARPVCAHKAPALDRRR